MESTITEQYLAGTSSDTVDQVAQKLVDGFAIEKKFLAHARQQLTRPGAMPQMPLSLLTGVCDGTPAKPPTHRALTPVTL